MQYIQETSAIYNKIDNIGLFVDHYDLNKFESRNENYRMIFWKLLEIIKFIIWQKQ